MSEEIKVGEYIRTRYGEIGIITENYPRLKCKKRKNATIIEFNEITKHSPNIIDLIEVGDYVNGEKVVDIAEAPIKAIYTNDIKQELALIPIVNKDIKSIVTKEQFKGMEYKV